MDPKKVSAQFAAYVWFTNNKPDTPETRMAAHRFAREQWLTFLPLAHRGLGRLLIDIGKRRGRGEEARRGQIEKKCNPNRKLAVV